MLSGAKQNHDIDNTLWCNAQSISYQFIADCSSTSSYCRLTAAIHEYKKGSNEYINLPILHDSCYIPFRLKSRYSIWNKINYICTHSALFIIECGIFEFCSEKPLLTLLQQQKVIIKLQDSPKNNDMVVSC